MASLPLPTTAATSSSPFVKKAHGIKMIQTWRYGYEVSCNINHDQNPTSPLNVETPVGKLDRRKALIGLGGCGATALVGSPLAAAAPLSAPDITKCAEADLPAGAKTPNCCPPKSAKVLEFNLQSPANAMWVRPAAHLVDDEYIAKFSRAIQLMKELPDDDPRSFTQQADVHCAYCNGSYDQLGFPNLDLQVHNSWTFFPFHRYYLYFYEKILGKLIGDPSFAIPFWNWDSPGGMQMPALYTDPNSPLYDHFRDVTHQPPTLIDLDFNVEPVKNNVLNCRFR